MELYNLSPAAGSTKEAFRKGRGHGSGNGKTGIKICNYTFFNCITLASRKNYVNLA